MSILHSATKLGITFPPYHRFRGSVWKVHMLTTITLFLLQCLKHAEYLISGWAACIRTKSTLITCSNIMYVCMYVHPCDKWVPVNTTWRVLRLRMEKRPPIWRVAANILNKQSRRADKGWSSSLEVGRGANNGSPSKKGHVMQYSQGEMLPLETKLGG